MLTFFNKRLHNKKGFTLIELIVVIAIIGILAAIAVPRFTSVTDSAKDSATESNVRIAVSAVMMYMAENDAAVPTAATDLTPYLQGTFADLADEPTGATYTFAEAAGVVTITGTSPTGTEYTETID